MSNKSQQRSLYRPRHHPHQLFELSLTDSSGFSVTPLNYSQTQLHPKLIPIAQIPHKDEVYPDTSAFQNDEPYSKNHCDLKDCLDRQFKAIQVAPNKSSPNMKIVSPHKMDIVFDEEPARKRQ